MTGINGSLGVVQVLPVLLGALPLQEDIDESEAVYGALCGLLLHPDTAPRLAPYLPQTLQVCPPVLLGSICRQCERQHWEEELRSPENVQQRMAPSAHVHAWPTYSPINCKQGGERGHGGSRSVDVFRRSQVLTCIACTAHVLVFYCSGIAVACRCWEQC